jgi:hypothetical protein
MQNAYSTHSALAAAASFSPINFTVPRDFTPGAGMPGDRSASVAARQAFDDLKKTYLHALIDVPNSDWLRKQVSKAEEPVDLWLMRALVFAALEGADNDRRSRRQLLRRGIDSMFPDLDTPSNFAPL